MILEGKTEPQKKRRPHIGARIKSRRKALGLTLQELAERSGLSKPFLSQAERDLTTPSLMSMLALAKGLQVEVSYFMEIPQAQDMVRRADNPAQIAVASPVTYYDLSSALPDRKLDAVLMRIPPGHCFPVDTRNGEHFRYVLQGELHARAGDIQTVLKAGDSMHFDARAPHTVENRSDQEALLLYVGTPSVLQRGAPSDPA
ncbi:helix-turn-helix domain-containing protein [Caulobacter henricii]|uniref:XRE family transcriptional regulator n=1 Tax=Caulobacter henricii TaxID=69395 RepID=A0A0P0P113_9CAUL|nr:XRE family transcriptional regulator [Caulobacter henricii]ALL14143.1 XRE family transcriptional regulator [Caulobacter henricii]